MYFSIIIPVYNTHLTLGATLESVIQQTFQDFEIIIINDGSTHQLTIDILNEIPNSYKDYKIIIINKTNGGLCSARNEGLKYVNGKITIFLDSDDLLPLDALMNYYNAFEKFDVDLIQGKFFNFDTKKQWKAKSYEDLITATEVILPNSTKYFKAQALCVNPGNKAIKTSFLKENNIHFLNGCMMCEDHFYTSLVYSKQPKLLLLNKYIWFYRQGQQNKQSTGTWKESYLDDILMVLKELSNVLPKNFHKEYYKRFINYDLPKRIINPVTIECRKTHVNKTLAILNLIPQEYKNLYLDKELSKINNEKELFKYFKKQRLKHKIQSNFLLKNIKKINGFILKNLNVFYKKLKNKHRLIFCNFLYNFFSLIIPIKSNKITFAIRPRDGLKYLKEIKEEALKRKIFAVKTLLQDETKPLLLDDLRIMYHLSRSKMIFLDGHYWYLRGVKARRKQIVIQSWHAAGLGKKFGCDMYDKSTLDYKEQLKHHSSYTHALVSSEIASKAYMSAFNLKENQILKFGNIISDRIFANKISMDKAKKKLNIDNKKLILYAPTFRENTASTNKIGDFESKLDFNFLNNVLSDEYIFAIRVHQNYNNYKIPKNVIDLSKQDENIVLNATDILITDYSSIMFTFLHFRRPIILFAYDLITYMGERATYLDYRTNAPGYVVNNENELLNAILNIDNIFNIDLYDKYWKKYMEFCDGKTATRLVDFCETIIKKD